MSTEEQGTAYFLASDHRTLGQVARATWLLLAQQRQAAGLALPEPPREASLLSTPPGRPSHVGWLYSEHRVVVLIDARRHCLLQQVGARLDTLLFYTCVTPQVGNQCEEGFTLDQMGTTTAAFSQNFSTIAAGKAPLSRATVLRDTLRRQDERRGSAR